MKGRRPGNINGKGNVTCENRIYKYTERGVERVQNGGVSGVGKFLSLKVMINWGIGHTTDELYKIQRITNRGIYLRFKVRPSFQQTEQVRNRYGGFQNGPYIIPSYL